MKSGLGELSARMVLIVVAAQILWAGPIETLNVKTGLWQVTRVTKIGGMPPMSPELETRLTPSQREQVIKAWKERAAEEAKPTTTTTCITKEKLTSQTPFGEDNASCKHNVVTSTGSKLEVQQQCSLENGMKMNLNFHVDAIDSENVKGAVEVAAGSAVRPSFGNSTFTGKWISAACGNAK